MIEAEHTDSELLDLSDIVVRGKIVEKIDEIVYKGENISTIVSIYKFDVSESCLGIDNKKVNY